MSMDRPNRAINGFHSANKQAREAVKAEAPGIDPMRSWGNQAGEHPAQEYPGIDQDQTEGQQEEAQGRIAGSGVGSHLAQRAIAALDAEVPAVAGIDLLGLPGELNDDESQPLAPSLAALIWYQASHQRQGGLGAIGEGIVVAIAFATLAQGASAAPFAADGVGNDGGLTNIGQIADDQPSAKALSM